MVKLCNLVNLEFALDIQNDHDVGIVLLSLIMLLICLLLHATVRAIRLHFFSAAQIAQVAWPI